MHAHTLSTIRSSTGAKLPRVSQTPSFDARTEPTLPLRVGVPGLLGRSLLARALPRFLQQHPSIRIDLLTHETLCAADDPLHATLEIVAAGATPDHALCVGRLTEVVCASPEFIGLAGRPTTPAELDESHCIGLLDARSHRLSPWVFTREGRQQIVSPRARLTVADAQAAAEAAVGGVGFIRVFDFAVHAQVACGLLQLVLRDWNEASTHCVWLVHAGNLPVFPQLEIFAQFVTGLFPVHATADRYHA